MLGRLISLSHVNDPATTVLYPGDPPPADDLDPDDLCRPAVKIDVRGAVRGRSGLPGDPDLRSPPTTTTVMMRRTTAGTLILLAVVVATIGAGQAGLFDAFVTRAVNNAAQFLGAVAAVACALWTARRYHGPQRAWRLWLALGMTFWGVGQVLWSYGQLFADTPLPSPSLADAGYLGLVPPALMALICLAGRRTPPNEIMRLPSRTVVVLDGLILVGACFVLTWSTALGAVVRAGAPTPVAFTVAIAYPITDLMLIIIVVLLLANSPVPRRQPQLVLLGAGLAAICFSDSVFAYLVASGADAMPPLFDAGFVIGPPLLALAALTPPAPPAEPGEVSRARWGYLLLPYVPVAATCALIVAQLARGLPVGRLEIAVEVLVIALIITRQAITLVENARLLDRVTEGRQKLTHQAYHDQLTGLANRALFRDRLDRALVTHRRDGGPLAVLFLDLDDFKAVNDRYGHETGDLLLQAVAERLRPAAATVARLGGDEFAVLLEDVPDVAGTARRLLDSLRKPFQVNGRALTIGASVGFVDAAEHDGTTAEALVRRADAAMYAGKRGGKNTVVRYHPDLTELLARALAHEGLDVHYQPIVRLADGAVIAVEALARWTDPVAGPVPADLFITVAERAGLVGRVDDFVLDRACRDATRFTGAWAGAVVHVNVSAARFGEPEQEAAVVGALRRHELAPQRLLLELTETARLDDLTAAVAAAQRLTALGVLLGLDDFGTGYNALHQLHTLPVDVVKLDRSLVAAGTGRSAAVCRSVVAICTAMGVKVIAEGLENDEQVAMMAALGCGYGQGHRYGRPGPLSAPAAGGAALAELREP
ncbi:MAG TPA: EAL domain-containing protein [Actinoplanes sp.]|nr:EAL domain-containing protein [Actinoplanes sp.]